MNKILFLFFEWECSQLKTFIASHSPRVKGDLVLHLRTVWCKLESTVWRLSESYCSDKRGHTQLTSDFCPYSSPFSAWNLHTMTKPAKNNGIEIGRTLIHGDISSGCTRLSLLTFLILATGEKENIDLSLRLLLRVGCCYTQRDMVLMGIVLSLC